MQSTLIEILAERHYCLSKAVFPGIRANVFNFLQTRERQEVAHETRIRSFAAYEGGKRVTDAASLLNFRAYDDDDDDMDDDDDRKENPAVKSEDRKVINIVRLTGPMTRGGGACSYGSLELRDILMEAADRDDVVAHIIYTRTPGGAASTLIDFRKAIDYIHERGQKIYMFCDGTVASGGTFLGAMCDGIYAFNGDDEIGSIGMYTAFFTLKDGAVNTITQETYHEYYAEKSTEKNKAYRDAAEGDMESVKKETEEYLDELLTNLRADRPSITEEQQSGAMYKMKDVIGTLIDGICSLGELCDMAFQEWSEAAPSGNRQANINPNNNNQTMSKSKEYKEIAALCGESSYVSDLDGILSLQPEQADALEARLPGLLSAERTLSAENTRLKEEQVTLGSLLASITGERDELKKQVEELQAKLSAKSEEAFAEERDALQSQIDGLKAEKETLQSEKSSLEEKVNTLNTGKEEAEKQLAEKDQIINDLNANLEQLNSGSATVSGAGASPKDNGQAAGAMKMTSAPTWDDTKTPSENQAAMKAYMDEQRRKATKK